MSYSRNQALGFIETVGMTPALEGADKMLKAADVELVGYENIGSTLVTVVIAGDVAAVRSAVKSGADAAAHVGKLTAQNVIARPIAAVHEVVAVHDVDDQAEAVAPSVEIAPYSALGSIETFGLVFVLEAADAMAKAADVELLGYENTASGYISILVGGDVGACQTAVAAGVKAVADLGAEVYSSVVIARPHADLKKITAQYALENLLAAPVAPAPDPAPAPAPVAAAPKPAATPAASATKEVKR